MKLVTGYFVVVAAILVYLVAVDPAVMAIAAVGGVVICVGFYTVGCWLGFFHGEPARRNKSEPNSKG